MLCCKQTTAPATGRGLLERFAAALRLARPVAAARLGCAIARIERALSQHSDAPAPAPSASRARALHENQLRSLKNELGIVCAAIVFVCVVCQLLCCGVVRVMPIACCDITLSVSPHPHPRQCSACAFDSHACGATPNCANSTTACEPEAPFPVTAVGSH